ncbi:MAG: hypothetical protein WDW36_003462 [Sanguina aurantia]
MRALLERCIAQACREAVRQRSSSTTATATATPAPSTQPPPHGSSSSSSSSASTAGPTLPTPAHSGGANGGPPDATRQLPPRRSPSPTQARLLAGPRPRLQHWEVSALATAYVEDCLCGALGAYIVAARWLDGPQGRELMREEGARTLLYSQVVQRMPGGASLEALRQQKLARLQAAAAAGAGASHSSSLPHETPTTPPGRTMAAAARAALQPWVASLAAPVAQAKAQAGVLLTGVHGAFVNPSWSLPASHRSASAPAGHTSAPAVAGTSCSPSDKGCSSSSSSQVGQLAQQTEDSSAAEAHAGCGASGGGGGVTASAGAGAGGGGVDYASAAKVVAVAVAAAVLLYALKAEQKNIRAAAKRALGRGRALVGEFAGLALTFSPNPIAAAGLASRR